MNELALFAGAGGGILGGKLLGWRTRCAVEFDSYAARVLLARQRDGALDRFPIWDDVRTFDGRRWRGSIDVVSGGFPCQDISCAGKGAGIGGERSGLWSEMARIVGEVRPRFVFVENSPLLVSRGLDRVLTDLASLGFDATWGVVGADDVGAPHRRKRFWLVADRDGEGLAERELRGRDSRQAERSVAGQDAVLGRLAWTEGRDRLMWQTPSAQKTTRSGELVNADGTPWDGESKPHSKATGLPVQTALLDQIATRATWATPVSKSVSGGRMGRDGGAHARAAMVEQHGEEVMRQVTGGRLNPRWVEWLMGFPIGWTSLDPLPSDAMDRWLDPDWWAIDPADVGEIPRVSEKEPNRAGQLKALGNAQVPLCAATAWSLLSGSLTDC